MSFLSKKDCFKFLSAFLATVLLITFIPFNAVKVSAVEGDGPYEIYVIDEKTNSMRITSTVFTVITEMMNFRITESSTHQSTLTLSKESSQTAQSCTPKTARSTRFCAKKCPLTSQARKSSRK